MPTNEQILKRVDEIWKEYIADIRSGKADPYPMAGMVSFARYCVHKIIDKPIEGKPHKEPSIQVKADAWDKLYQFAVENSSHAITDLMDSLYKGIEKDQVDDKIRSGKTVL